MKRATNIRVALTFLGEFDPEFISRELSANPTATWRKGEMVGKAPLLTHRTDGWSLTAVDSPSLNLDEQMVSVAHLIDSKRASIRRLTGEAGVLGEVSVAIDVSDDAVPSIALTVSQIKTIADAGLSLDVDVVLG